MRNSDVCNCPGPSPSCCLYSYLMIISFYMWRTHYYKLNSVLSLLFPSADQPAPVLCLPPWQGQTEPPLRAWQTHTFCLPSILFILSSLSQTTHSLLQLKVLRDLIEKKPDSICLKPTKGGSHSRISDQPSQCIIIKFSEVSQPVIYIFMAALGPWRPGWEWPVQAKAEYNDEENSKCQQANSVSFTCDTPSCLAWYSS